MSNERKLHQEFKYAIRKYFLPTWKFLYAKSDMSRCTRRANLTGQNKVDLIMNFFLLSCMIV